MRKMGEALSKRYAENAEGVVHYVNPTRSPGAMWKMEKKILKKRMESGDVTRINRVKIEKTKKL
jgi:hypothetical protein